MVMGSLSLVFIHYFIATRNSRFLLPFTAVAALLIVSLFFFSGKMIPRIVFIQIIANAALLASMIAVFLFRSQKMKK